MLRSQTLQLRQSEIRSCLAELQGDDDIDDEQRHQVDELATEYRRNETDYRAAMISEEADRQANTPDDNQAVEWRRHIDNFEIRQAVGVLTEKTGRLNGPTAEVVEELSNQEGAKYRGVPIPLDVLAPVETRADTTSATTPTPEVTMPIIDRVFANSVAARMGVRQVSIPFGDKVYPIATAGAQFNWVASEGADLAEALVYTTGDQTLEPDHTGGCRIDVTREAMKQSGPNLEAAIRRDMRAAITVGLDQATFLGTGAAGQPTGIMVDGATPSTAVGALVSYAPFREAAIQMMVDDVAGSFDGIRILARPEILSAMDDALLAGTSETEWDRLVRRFAAPVLSSNTLATPAGNPLAFDGLMTTNYNGVPPVWSGLWGGIDMISDQFTGAASGTLKLTALLTFDLAISRPVQLRKLTGLQIVAP